MTAATRGALAHLVEPFDPADLRALDCPIHIDQRPGHYRELFDLGALVAAVRQPDAHRLRIRAGGEQPPSTVDLSTLAAAYDRGTIVEVAPLDQADDRLGAYVRAVKREGGHAGPVVATGVLAPPGAAGTRHDPAPTANLQIEGRTRWRYVRGDGEGSAQCTAEEAFLEPGDLLCMPAGKWCECEAIDRSLTLAIAFAPMTAWDLLIGVLATVLRESAEWRRALPAWPPAGREVPEPVRRFLADRLVELAGLIRTLDPGADPIAAAWHAAIAGESATAADPPEDHDAR
jgi:Cupin superfamily protein